MTTHTAHTSEATTPYPAPDHGADPYGGSTWSLHTWQDDALADASDDPSYLAAMADDVEQLFGTTPSASLAHLAACQTWQEVLGLPNNPTQRLPIMVAPDPQPREACPLSERPGRGTTTWTGPAGSVHRVDHGAGYSRYVRGADDDGAITLAADGSMATERGTSSVRAAAAKKAAATRKANQLARALAAGEILAEDATPKRAEPARLPVLEDGEVIGYVNADGSIG